VRVEITAVFLLRGERMFDAFDAMFFESCFPGAVSGQAEVTCPHCGTMLTVRVGDPLGDESYCCGECGDDFHVDWGHETVTPL
jgi:DNA-directed RNA polymerase subunit RPC12/RpoP